MDLNENELDILQNKNPEILNNLYTNVIDFFINFGWYSLFAIIILLYIYSKLQTRIKKYFQLKEENEYDAKYHKDSDLYRDRQIAMEKSRQKMQQNLERASIIYREKKEQENEIRRTKVIEKANAFLTGNRLGNGKTSLKTDYNPLMGSSSNSSTYKAPKRSVCSGSNCGK